MSESEEQMSSHAEGEPFGQLMIADRWLTSRVIKGAIVITWILSYLMSIMQATSLTLLSFLGFTAVNVLYGLALWWLYREESEKPPWTLAVGILSLLTVLCGIFLNVMIGLDWLLYFATNSLYFTYFSLRRAIIASIGLYLTCMVNILLFSHWRDIHSDWASILAGFVFVGAFSLANRLLDREQRRSRRLLRELENSNQELAVAHQQLQSYAREVEELAITRERTRMAREIHDTLGHYLAIIRIQLETISKLQERDPAQAMVEIEEAKRVAAQCIQEVRNAVAALRPTSIATLNLTEALSQLGAEFRAASPEIALTLDLDTTLPPLSAELQLAAYRTAQEALTNVRKHAQASRVLLRLRYEQGTLEVMVRDNGVPSPAKQQTGGFGLIGLRERIDLLGGQLSYGPLEPIGYRVAALIPLPPTQIQSAHHLVEKGEAVE